MKLIEYLTSQRLSQREFGRILAPPVSQGMVGHWIAGRHSISAERAKAIELATNGAVQRHELRPDIFDPPATAAPVSVEEVTHAG